MKVSIDRFEGKNAVCENPDQTSMIIEKSRLPEGANEGDVLDITDDKITVDAEETAHRKKRIEESVNNLFD